MPPRIRYSLLKTTNTAPAYAGIPGELAVNTDTGRCVTYDGATVGGTPHATLGDLQDLNLQSFPANTLLANMGGTAGPPSFTSLMAVAAATVPVAEIGTPLTGRDIGLEDDETNALATVPLARDVLAINNRDHFRDFRDSRLLQVITRASATVGVYTFTVRGFGSGAFATATCNVTIGAAEPNDTTITNLVGALNGVVGRNYTATATGTLGAKVCTITTVAGGRTVVYASNAVVFLLDANTDDAVLDLRSLKTIPFYKITGQASAICISGIATNVRRAIRGKTEVFGTRNQTKVVAMGPGTGTFATIEFIDGAQGLYLHDLTLAQDDIYPWLVINVTRLLGTPGTYNLTVTGTGPASFGPTVVPITIGAAEPNDTTIANVVAALNGVAGRTYTAVIAGTAPATYASVVQDVSSRDRFTIVSATPTVLAATNTTEEQLHLLRCKNAAGADRATGQVLVERVAYRAAIGAGLNMFGEAGRIVENVYVADCDFNVANPDIGLGIGGRSCIELQRGLRHIYFYRCTGVGAKNSVLDCEVTAVGFFLDYAQRHIHFYDCVFDNIAGRTTALAGIGGVNGSTFTGSADPLGTQVAAVGDLYLRTAASGARVIYKKISGGIDSTGWTLAPLLRSECMVSDISFTRCVFREATVSSFYAEDLLFDACRFEYTGGRNAPAVDALFGAAPLLSISQQNINVTVRNSTFWRGPSAPSGVLINVAGAANGAGLAYRRPAGISFVNNDVYNASYSGFAIFNDCAGLVLRSNRFVMNRGAMDVGAANTAFNLSGVNHDVTDVLIADNTFISQGAYKFFWLFSLGFGVTALRVSKNLTITNNQYGNALSTSYSDAAFILFSMSAAAAALGSIHERNPIMHGNDGGLVKNLWTAEALVSAKIQPVVSGSAGRNSAKVLEGVVSAPEGAVLNDGSGVIAGVGDRYRYINRLATTSFWRKTSTSVAGVPDNKGWVQELIAPPPMESLADPAAPFAVIDTYGSSAAYVTNVAGTGAAITVLSGTATRGARMQAATGTTTTGRAARSVSASGGGLVALGAASGVWVYKLLGWSYSTLSDGVETFAVRAAFQDNITGTSADGAWFDIDTTASTDLRCVTSSNGVRTFTTTGVVLAINTDYDFKAVITNNTAVDFYYRLSNTAATGVWSFLVRHTTNIPSGTLRAFSAGLTLIKRAGTTLRTCEWQTQVLFQLPT